MVQAVTFCLLFCIFVAAESVSHISYEIKDGKPGLQIENIKLIGERHFQKKKDGHFDKGKHGLHMKGHKQHKDFMIDQDEVLSLKNRFQHLRLTKGECSTPCGHDEVCVRHKRDGATKCISREGLRESRRLYRKFKHFKKGKRGFKKGDHKRFFYFMEKMDRLDHPSWKKKHHMKRNKHFGMKHNKLRNMTPKEQKRMNEMQLLEESENIAELIEKSGYRPEERKSHAHGCDNKFSTVEHLLNDWFAAMERRRAAKRHHKNRKGHHGKHRGFGRRQGRFGHFSAGKCNCARSAIHEFKKLDRNKDRHLNREEIIRLEAAHQEPCIGPFLNTCDIDQDKKLSRHEFCCCFADSTTEDNSFVGRRINGVHRM